MTQEHFIPYPLKFEPIFKEKVWGAQNLNAIYGKDTPAKKKIGESWEVSGFPGYVSKVADGAYKGQLFTDLIKKFSKSFIGSEIFRRFDDKFPLLYKLIDAAEPFSLQVHPGDSFAVEFENGSWGKTELWYIVHASADAKIISGFKEWVDEEAFVKAVENGNVESCLEEVDVRAGDAFYVPAGRVHATRGSLVFFEVQENSDLSYRIYDWGRTGNQARHRDLQIEKALSVINYQDYDEKILSPILVKSGEVEERLLIACDHFTVEKIKIKNEYMSKCEGEKFFVVFVLGGKGRIAYGKELNDLVDFKSGEFFFLPASLGNYKVIADGGEVELLKSFVT